MLLRGMNVFITGGSRGLGQGAVFELVRQGANVAFTFCNNEEEAKNTKLLAEKISKNRSMIKFYRLDLRKHGDIQRVVEASISDFGSMDVVVNNAGKVQDNIVLNMTDEDWNYIIEINLTGTFFICREFLSEFLYNGKGKFINVSSISYTGLAGQANYAAAKAGIIGFSKSMAKEYGGKGIYTNVIVPGYFDTRMTQTNASKSVFDASISLASLKRVGLKEEYGKAVVYLASDFSSFVNGHVLEVTGGLDCLPPPS